MDQLPCRTIVRNKKDNQMGVVVSDQFGCCTTDETPVVYEETTSYLGTATKDMEVIGHEDPVADFDKCGGGTDQCCIFMAADSKGLTCQRFGEGRNSIIFKSHQMIAQRHPTALYPKCQLK